MTILNTLLAHTARSACLFLALLAPAASAGGPVEAAVSRHLAAHSDTLLLSFRDFLSLPNVSTVPADMRANADWLTAFVEQRGFSTRITSAGGAPYVIAERLILGADETLLIYAHYDGQPVEPANWQTPPFEPTLKSGDVALPWSSVRDGPIDADWRVYARSAGDDKAPVIALMHAIDALEAAGLAPSVNLKLILDGEEEFGSPTLGRILEENADSLDADLMLFCDGPMHQSGRRQLVFGVRGDVGVHLTTYGASRPLHSGHYGNWAPHPTDTMIRLLASLKDAEGNITVPGYLDQVQPVSAQEQKAIDAMPRVDDRLQEELSLGRVEGEGERLETLIMRPAINIVGFQAGGVGDQARNIILPSARASLDLRLVQAQTLPQVRETLEAHFAAQGFHVIHEEPSAVVRRQHPRVLRVEWTGGYPAYRSALDSGPAMRLRRILEDFEGTPPLMTPTLGGSLPVYLFDRKLGLPVVLLPIANHDNNQHGRDENLRVGNLFSAIGAFAAVLYEYGRD